ncbi:hypothetical protein [Rhodococcus koreensis]
MTVVLSFYVVVAVVCAGISAAIANKKNRDTLGFLVIGFLFGPIGVLASAVVASGRPAAPEGFVAVTCPRCNTDQRPPGTSRNSRATSAKQNPAYWKPVATS